MGEATASRPVVLLAGGGTGGHVTPALATAEALEARRGDLACAFVGVPGGVEQRMVAEAGWPLHTVAVRPLSRRLGVGLLRVPFALIGAVRALRAVIASRDVVAAVCFGGYVALPLALAARSRGVPVVVHEQNAVPGLANRLSARIAEVVAISWPDTARMGGRRSRIELVGNPPRPSLVTADLAALRPEALEAFGLAADRPTLLVFGGSQGAEAINNALLSAADRFDPSEVQILHVAGRRHHERLVAAWQDLGADGERGPLVACVDFVDRMDLAYAAADLVLCRAGASTLAELTALGLPSILVPYPHATADHQTANARVLADAGAAIRVTDDELDGRRLAELVAPLLNAPAEIRRMADAARTLARPEAADALADLVLEVAGARLRRAGGGLGQDGTHL